MFKQACRTAVSEDIIQFKRDNLKSDSVCPHLGIPLNSENSHVDHVKPITFKHIVAEFLEGYSLSVDDFRVIGDVQKRFEDIEMANLFRRFHNEITVLELVSEIANQTVCRPDWKG